METTKPSILVNLFGTPKKATKTAIIIAVAALLIGAAAWIACAIIIAA